MRTPSVDMEPVLIDAAVALLEAEGPDALSVRRIAAAAGVAPMGVYNHFSSKAGIVEAVFIQGFARLRDAMSSLGEIDDPEQALWEGGRRYRARALANPMTYQVMFLRAVAGFEPSDHARQVSSEAFDGLVSTVRRAMQAGFLAVDDPAEVSQRIWAACHGWISIELCAMSFVDTSDEASDRMCRSLFVGLCSRG